MTEPTPAPEPTPKARITGQVMHNGTQLVILELSHQVPIMKGKFRGQSTVIALADAMGNLHFVPSTAQALANHGFELWTQPPPEEAPPEQPTGPVAVETPPEVADENPQP